MMTLVNQKKMSEIDFNLEKLNVLFEETDSMDSRARAMGVSRTNARSIFEGKTTPKASSIASLCNHFNLRPDYFFNIPKSEYWAFLRLAITKLDTNWQPKTADEKEEKELIINTLRKIDL